jgi:hypothetical protein
MCKGTGKGMGIGHGTAGWARPGEPPFPFPYP